MTWPTMCEKRVMLINIFHWYFFLLRFYVFILCLKSSNLLIYTITAVLWYTAIFNTNALYMCKIRPWKVLNGPVLSNGSSILEINLTMHPLIYFLHIQKTTHQMHFTFMHSSLHIHQNSLVCVTHIHIHSPADRPTNEPFHSFVHSPFTRNATTCKYRECRNEKWKFL